MQVWARLPPFQRDSQFDSVAVYPRGLGKIGGWEEVRWRESIIESKTESKTEMKQLILNELIL